jgi:hypothetical protein
MMTAVQGIVAAGTVAYLTRDATWEKIAFTSNHLFYLVGIAAHAAAVDIPHFSLAAKVVFCLTPIVLIEHLRQGQESTTKARSFGFHFNHFYYAAAVVSTLVLVALGHMAYGVGFFSVMMLDMISRSKSVNAYVNTSFEWSATTAALLTFASRAVSLTTPRGQYIMGVVATLAFLPRICLILDAPRPKQGKIHQNLPRVERPIYPWSDQWHRNFTRSMMTPVRVFPAAPSAGPSTPSRYVQGVRSVTGIWPGRV